MSDVLLEGKWTLYGNGNGKDVKCDVTIPGDFHSALLDNGVIKDPYFGFN